MSVNVGMCVRVIGVCVCVCVRVIGVCVCAVNVGMCVRVIGVCVCVRVIGVCVRVRVSEEEVVGRRVGGGWVGRPGSRSAGAAPKSKNPTQ